MNALRYFIIFLTAFLSIASNKSFGQTNNPSPTDLSSHDLKWVTSNNDFDQSNLLKSDIENKIHDLINSATARNTPMAEMELPFNWKELKYLGHMHPNELNIFTGYPVSNTNDTSINKQLYIYQYKNFYFSTQTDEAHDQQDVYYAIRAINILQYRYSEAFQKLFTETMTFSTDHPQFRNNFSNSNKAYWIAFNQSPQAIAVSYTSFLPDGVFDDSISKYSNIIVINIHANTILGTNETRGSKPIFHFDDQNDNYKAYMAGALAETLTHEMIHRYIDWAYISNIRFNQIRSLRGARDYIYAEENAVLNTSLKYFKRKGGLSDIYIQYYYTKTFNVNIQFLKDDGLLDLYASSVAGKTANDDYLNTFLFDILN